MQLTDIAKFNTFQSVPSLTDIAKFNTFPSLLTIPSSLQYQFMTISSSIHYKFSNKRHKYKATGPSSCCCWFLHCSHVTKATKTTCTKVTKDIQIFLLLLCCLQWEVLQDPLAPSANAWTGCQLWGSLTPSHWPWPICHLVFGLAPSGQWVGTLQEWTCG